MYFFGDPVHDHTSLKSSVMVGVIVTTANEVGSRPWMTIWPVGPMVALAIIPVLEIVTELIQTGDHECVTSIPSVSAVLAELPARTSSDTKE